MKQLTELWSRVNRLIPIAGLVGFMLGLLFGGLNQDEVGWTILKAVILSLVFAYATKHILVRLMRVWIENKLKEAEDKKAEDKKGKAATNVGKSEPAKGAMNASKVEAGKTK